MLSHRCAAAVAARFGLGEDPVLTGPVARGEMGRVWSLTTSRGRFAVKDPFEEIDLEEAERAAAYQDAVGAAGVPVPASVRTREGEVSARIEHTSVRVYEWVDVLDRDRGLDPATVGALVAGIHGVVLPPSGPVDPWYAAPVGAADWKDLVARLRRRRAPFVDELDALVPGILRSEAVIEPYAATQRCHLDLWADNVRRTPDGGMCVLDWESSGPGAPTQELGVVAFEFGLGSPERIGTLVAAYADAGGTGRLTRPGDLTALVAQTAHIAVTGCERWLDARSEAERGRLEAWVREYVDEPVTLETVALILDSA